MPFPAVTAPAPRLVVSTARPCGRASIARSRGRTTRASTCALARDNRGVSREGDTSGEARAGTSSARANDENASPLSTDTTATAEEITRRSVDVKSAASPSRRGALVGAAAGFAWAIRPVPPAHARATAVVRADAVRLGGKANAKSAVTLTLALPPEYHLTKGANSRFEVTLDDAAVARGVVVDKTSGPLVDSEDVKLRFSFASANDALAPVPDDEEEAGAAKVECAVYFCRENDVCLLQRARFEVPFAGAADADADVALRFDVQANEPPPPVNAAAIPTFD